MNLEKLNLISETMKASISKNESAKVLDSLEKKLSKQKRKTFSLLKKWLCNLRIHTELLSSDMTETSLFLNFFDQFVKTCLIDGYGSKLN